MATIGQKLEETRLQRGLTVEDVAYRTRIPRHMIVRIEEDDFSQFPSVAYAKSFIGKYSRHLGLDLSGAISALDSGITRLGDNALMGEMKRTIKKDRLFHFERFGRRPRRIRGDRPGRAPLLLNLILAALITFLGLFYFLGYNAPNLEQAQRNIIEGLGLAEEAAPKIPPATKPALIAVPIEEPAPSPQAALPAPRPRAEGPDPAADLPTGPGALR